MTNATAIDESSRSTMNTKNQINNQQDNRIGEINKQLIRVKLSSSTNTQDNSSQSETCNQNNSTTTTTMNSKEAQKPLDKVVCVDEFEEIAKEKLSKCVYDYYYQGADDEVTLNWNRRMISEKYCLKPKVMCDVSKVDLTKYIFGDKLSMPIAISPTALHAMAHPDGEIATVRACNRLNALMVLSLFSTTSLENVANEAPICIKWQNIYILKNRDITQNVINRAIRYGYRALVVTCDAPILGNRRRDLKNNFTLGQFTLENINDSSVKSMREHSSEIFDPSICWQDLADLKKSVGNSIRVIVKGIMTPEDAEKALEAGVDGIFVSNHGGRQLDGCPSTIEMLPKIVKVVNKRCPVFVDGGFRTGADILKALALGADMVFVGRPPLWGLVGYGEGGVYTAMNMLKQELIKAMMLTGCTKLSDITSDLIYER